MVAHGEPPGVTDMALMQRRDWTIHAQVDSRMSRLGRVVSQALVLGAVGAVVSEMGEHLGRVDLLTYILCV